MEKEQNLIDYATDLTQFDSRISIYYELLKRVKQIKEELIELAVKMEKSIEKDKGETYKKIYDFTKEITSLAKKRVAKEKDKEATVKE